MDTNLTDPGASPLPNTTVPTSKAMNTVSAAFVILGVTVGAILLHLVLSYVFKKIAEKTVWQFDDDVVKYCKKPTFVMFPTIGLLITIQLVTLPVGVYGVLNHVFIIILIFSITLFVVMLIKCASLAVARSNSRMKDTEPKRAREVETQIVVMTRIVQGLVWLLGLSGIAMTFPNAWQVGVSLLASASVTALLLGVAAKPAIENAFASLAIAMTQPFLLEDQVQVDGEVGHIEEIQSQYVIMRTLDERRLVIPLTWFLANIFQNWSRNSAQQIGMCKIFVDYTTAVPRIRQYFLRFARAHPLYDGRHCSLLVTDCTLGTIELTCQVSVANAMDVMQISSDVREAMVEFIARSKLELSATGTSSASMRGLANLVEDLGGVGGGDGGQANVVNEHGEIVQAPPPPLTTEDVKMGSGSKLYQQIPLITTGKDIVDKDEVNEKPVSGKTTALSVVKRDHIQVTVEDVDSDGGIATTNGNGAGLTRRAVGSGGGSDADNVVPALGVSNSGGTSEKAPLNKS
ncbi:MAG: Mechanosensitive ion channel-domain-containing protein [Linnemannia gamsii]|nr:MAG: Mechanosensitive ion channel-domain-containing protein [Linnemannia gamsii]